MKRIIIATSLAALVGLSSCTEHYQSSIDFGDNTYINDYSELAKAINDLNKSLNERLSALNQLLEEQLVAIKISINAQTHAIQAQSTSIEQGLGQINTSLLNGFAATQRAINAQGEQIITALNANGELITLHIDKTGELISTELQASTATLMSCMNANTATLAGKLDHINAKLDAINQAINNGFISIQGDQVNSSTHINQLDQSIQALIAEVASSARAILAGLTTLNASVDTQTNTLKIALNDVKTEVIQLSADQTAALTALQNEVESQGGRLEYAILNDETVVVNAIDAMGYLLKTQLVTINQTLTTQTTTLQQAIATNTTAANAIATAVGLTTAEVQRLITAINTNDAAALAELQQQNASLANLLSYSDGIILNGEPDPNQQYASINVTSSVWNEATTNAAIMTFINNLLAPQGAPTPQPTQYVTSSINDYSENYTHTHSIWTRVADNNVVTALSGSVTQNNVTMLTVKRVYETSVFDVTIWEYCSHPHIHSIMIIDAEHTDYYLYYNNTGTVSNVTTAVSVTFKNYDNGTYCPNPLAKVYCNY